MSDDDVITDCATGIVESLKKTNSPWLSHLPGKQREVYFCRSSLLCPQYAVLLLFFFPFWSSHLFSRCLVLRSCRAENQVLQYRKHDFQGDFFAFCSLEVDAEITCFDV